MERFFNGPQASFNQTYYDQLLTCLSDQSDTESVQSQISAWYGEIEYWRMNGTKNDTWGILTEDPTQEHMYIESREHKGASMGEYHEMIYEPCNFVSNLAYTRSALRVCEYGDNWTIKTDEQMAMKRGFAILGAQSAFFHGSMTWTGVDWDNQAIALIASLGQWF